MVKVTTRDFLLLLPEAIRSCQVLPALRSPYTLRERGGGTVWHMDMTKIFMFADYQTKS